MYSVCVSRKAELNIGWDCRNFVKLGNSSNYCMPTHLAEETTRMMCVFFLLHATFLLTVPNNINLNVPLQADGLVVP